MSMAIATVEGLVGADPEKFKAGEHKGVNFRVATNSKVNGEDKTFWHSCTAFGKNAENLAKHVKKGSPVIVNGMLQVDSWEKDGVKRERHKILVSSWSFAGRKPSNEPSQGADW